MKYLSFSVLFLSIVSVGVAQTVVIMPDSTNNRVVSFNPLDGSLINGNLFAITPSTTPVHAMQVGNEIWISEQVGDKVSRWSGTGTSLGAITGGMDNIRGMEQIGSTVYVTNAGTANGAPGAAIVMFSNTGSSLGFVSTAGLSPSPFGILDHQGGMLVSSSSANDDIHRFTTAVGSLGTFHNSASLAFPEQMTHNASGEVLVANFTTGGISRHDPTSGALLGTFGPASGLRGIFQLGNGNVLYSNASGAFVWNMATGGSTQVYAGGGRYFDTFNAVPEPATLTLLGLGYAALLRRRRK